MSTRHALRYRIRTTGTTSRLTLAGELDAITVPDLVEDIETLVFLGVRTLFVDLSDIEFVDAAGLRPIFAARARGVDIELSNPSEAAQRVLRALACPWTIDLLVIKPA
jgi:anti-anti-sigma factor